MTGPAGPPAVAALVTHPDGRILLVPTKAEGWALPTAVPTAGETPRQAATRAVDEAVGLTPRVGGPLLLDWTSEGTYQIFDGGDVGGSAVRRIEAGGRAVLVSPGDLPTRTAPAEAYRIDNALRARAGGTTAYLEQGEVPAVLAAMRRYRIAPRLHSGAAWTWHTGPVPAELPIRHCWVWLFVPDGRVVGYVDVAGTVGLPGGTLEPHEGRDAVAAAIREVAEETQLGMTDPVHIGYLVDDQPGCRPVARVRMAAAVTTIGSSAPDPATGTVHRRILVPPRLVGELCGWGAGAAAQAEAAITVAAREWAIPEPDPALGVTELTDGPIAGRVAPVDC